VHEWISATVRLPNPLKAISGRLRHITSVLGYLVIAACSSPDLSSGDVEIVDLEFEDPVLKSCISALASRNDWRLSGQVSHLECTNSQADKIRTLDGIEALINLQSLNLAHNTISDPVLLDELRRLTILHLGHNDIQLVRFSRLHETLEALNLDNNKIYDVTWLATFYRLEQLSMSQNQLRLIPAVVGLDSIKSLDLSHNDIVDVTPLKTLPIVESINLQDNSLDCAAIDDLKRSLPSGVDILTDCVSPERKAQKD